jgi:hypothetical protein
MKLLQEITDWDIWLRHNIEWLYKVRKATRVFLTREDWKVAMLYNWKGGYHKLVGGGYRRMRGYSSSSISWS